MLNINAVNNVNIMFSINMPLTHFQFSINIIIKSISIIHIMLSINIVNNMNFTLNINIINVFIISTINSVNVSAIINVNII